MGGWNTGWRLWVPPGTPFQDALVGPELAVPGAARSAPALEEGNVRGQRGVQRKGRGEAVIAVDAWKANRRCRGRKGGRG